MFHVKLQLISLYGSLDLSIPLCLKICKKHWHYSLIQNLSQFILDTKHSFQLPQKYEEEPTFQLMLVHPTSKNHIKILGIAIINIKQWPINQTKRNKVMLCPQATLDLQITYQYQVISNSSSILNETLEDIELKQRLSVTNQINNLLKTDLKQLSEEYQKQKEKATKLIRRNRQLMTRKSQIKQKHFIQIEKIGKENQDFKQEVGRVNLILTKLINLILSEGDIKVIERMTNTLQHESRK